MLGYNLMPEGRWKHEFEVADLHEFLDTLFSNGANPTVLTKLRVHTVQEVGLPDGGDMGFQLRAQHVRANPTLEWAYEARQLHDAAEGKPTNSIPDGANFKADEIVEPLHDLAFSFPEDV